LSYWRRDEGELYYPLPKNKEADLADIFSPTKTVDRCQWKCVNMIGLPGIP
ncbi:hypothetical protein scyTo_0021276, partial [Scyliorhinus torazame]|nr:hypothetical protein [Scyliorhinus torazame]